MQDRDYTLIVDISGSMSIPDQLYGRTRWQAARASILALARKCEQLDPDGITVYLFSNRFRRYENVTSSKALQIFKQHYPLGITNLAGVLKDAIDQYFERKASGKTKPGGETILVITDGEPYDRNAVMRVIIEATRQIERDKELAISLIQVGTDAKATRFLKTLDDELHAAGAKFDIVNTISLDDMENMSLADVLVNAIND